LQPLASTETSFETEIATESNVEVMPISNTKGALVPESAATVHAEPAVESTLIAFDIPLTSTSTRLGTAPLPATTTTHHPSLWERAYSK